MFYRNISLSHNVPKQNNSFIKSLKPAEIHQILKMKLLTGTLAGVRCAQNDARHKRKFYTIE